MDPNLSTEESMQYLCLVLPPDLPGTFTQRTQSAGVGVAVPIRRIQRLLPRRPEARMLPPMEMLYGAAVAEKAGVSATLIDIGLEGWSGKTALTQLAERMPVPKEGDTLWIGVLVSM